MNKLNTCTFTGNSWSYTVDNSEYVVDIIEIKGVTYEAWLYSSCECVKQLIRMEDVFENKLSLDDFIKKVEAILPEAIISYFDKYVDKYVP